MFWERFEQLCKEIGSKPNPVVKELGLSNSITTKWKNGAIPNGEILLKIADYFNVSIDYLMAEQIIPIRIKNKIKRVTIVSTKLF